MLCDDPGLGKTLTAIALVAALVTSSHAHRVLIAVPASVLGVWKSEFARWTGGTLPLVVVGADEAGLHASLKLRDLGAVREPAQMEWRNADEKRMLQWKWHWAGCARLRSPSWPSWTVLPDCP